MGFLFAIFIGIFVATNFDNVPLNTQQEEKTIQVDTKKTVKNNTAIPEIKSQAKEAEPIKEEIKSEPKEVKPIKEEVNEIVNLEEAGTDWLKLILLALGAIFVVGSGTYLYNRTKNNSSSSSSNDYMRSKFKEKTQPETQEQQPSQEETQPETQEQQPSQEETQPETQEQQPSQEETQPETQEQQPSQEETQSETQEQQPSEEETQPETQEQQPSQEETQVQESTEEDENNKK